MTPTHPTPALWAPPAAASGRRSRATPIGVAALCLALGCAPPDRPEATSGSFVVEDDAGRAVTLSGPATRVLSLVPSATQTLNALGAKEALVGRTDFDTEAWAAGLPSVGGGLQPSLEAIVALRPQVVIVFEGEQDPATRERLEAVGIEWLAVRPDRVADVLRITHMLGRLVGREERARLLADSLRAGLDAVAEDALGRPELRVAYVMGGTPPWVAGPDTYIDELIRLAGGVNAFGDLGTLYASVSPEELVARSIDVVLTHDSAAFDRTLTPTARVAEVGDELQLPGPGVVEAARQVARALRSGGP